MTVGNTIFYYFYFCTTKVPVTDSYSLLGLTCTLHIKAEVIDSWISKSKENGVKWKTGCSVEITVFINTATFLGR
jgi:hypothetical protein